MTTDDKSGGLPDGAATEFTDAMSYGDYLGLERLLACQEPRSERHDEMLFIVIHQATELWMKLVLHELTAAMAHIRAGDLPPAFKMLARVSRIQAQLIQSWDVLSTLTPADYMTFRSVLGNASGFQSHQYRLIEFTLGNKNPAMLMPHRHDAHVHSLLSAALDAPSLYEEAILLLARRGLGIDAGQMKQNWRDVHDPDDSVRGAWLTVYRDTESHWDLYELAEKLVDLEDHFQQWRFHHVSTVERIIGHKRGTGGTSGVPYLRRALETRFFPELWDIRTEL
ncbi:MAG: tryptophan 2,3-dioxygenase [Proteobacteria bacterium]|nr:tryptophan 2,3-dioxygenase [Pseudomonadota bacterium]MDA1356011.1 tryptophan 2,3-dioxygenase [Pseudomonadota bacterium]